MAITPLSHRGFWLDPNERNTEAAFRRSFSHGFGVETDLRDRDGDVVIAHDPGDAPTMTFRRFLEMHADYPGDLPLALNIKADGLQRLIGELLQEFRVASYFVFDMSLPDLLGYRQRGLRYFTRVSEYENPPHLLDDAAGVWLDQFEGDWVDADAVGYYTDRGKQVCIVSPELHRRDFEGAWKHYRAISQSPAMNVFLCTDHPTRAREAFA